MKEVTLEELLEAGCHFGHQVTRSNPKARDFIFESRDNIHIIDLAKTKEGLDEAAEQVLSVAKNGGSLLVVASKKQAQPIVLEEVKRAQQEGADNLYYVTNRWIGGILTNLSEVSKNFKKLKDLTSKLNDQNEKSRYTKKEIGGWEKDRQKLQSLYGGVVDLKEQPTALFIVDTHMEDLAVREARRTGVTTVGITDTNSDPTIIDYPIPANDDAVGSLKLIVGHIIDAWIEGRKNPVNTSEEVQEEVKVEAKEEKEPKEKKAKAHKKDTSASSVQEKKAEESTEKPAAKRGRPKKATE